MLEEKIKNILEKEVKPMLALHLGSLDFVGFESGVVSVRLKGTCRGCPLSELTLKAGIEELLKSKIKEVRSVQALE
ncbi:MAG: NifU family protein [bacterium]|nr:NifU family protein [bacterium]